MRYELQNFIEVLMEADEDECKLIQQALTARMNHLKTMRGFENQAKYYVGDYVEFTGNFADKWLRGCKGTIEAITTKGFRVRITETAGSQNPTVAKRHRDKYMVVDFHTVTRTY